MGKAIIGAALLILALMVGCGGATGGAGRGGPSTSRTDPALDYPHGSGELVLRVQDTGGFLPLEAVFAQVPTHSLMGDGLLVAPGAVAAIYPGPALPPLWAHPLTENGVKKVLQAARDAGLTQELGDLGSPPVADAATTEITVAAGEGRVLNSIYALGMGDTDPGAGLTPAQQEARSRISAFLAKLADPEAWLGDDAAQSRPYVFPALAVQITPADGGQTGSTDVAPNVLAWPLGDLATLGSATAEGSLPTPPPGSRQAVIQGQDLVRLRPMLDQATAITVWTSGGRDYHLVFRPLLPDEVPSD